jgi:FkbM family methyltransferase
MKLLRRLRRLFEPNPNRFLRETRGVVHVGANVGQERGLYARHGLDVLWVEPIPEVFARLRANLRDYPRQRALEALVTDRDGAEYTFNLANNDGESSSILALKQHRDVYPTVVYTGSIRLEGVTLPTLCAREHVDLARYDSLVLDTQGSELLVLRGAESLLRQFRFIKTEVPDFEAYEGCAQLADLDAYLRGHGFTEWSRHPFATHEGGGRYYDIVYRR